MSTHGFEPVSAQVSFPKLEEEVLALWKEKRVFERSVTQRPESSAYVFYDGPPFATGLPHYGHLVASTLKDIVPRYWAMRGHRVERRFGWDTHGLPIESLVSNKLGLTGPSSVRAYGVDRFNEACRTNVLTYTKEWERIVGRLGRWVDFDNDYKTMDPTFMESVWWVFARLWEQGLVYEDFRVMPYSWALSTSLSNFEANANYKMVDDPAITLTMPLEDGSATLLVWTTTPWTLPSNLAIAVGEDLAYVKARKAGDETVYVVAAALAEQVLGADHEVLETVTGRALVGARYTPLFDYFRGHANAFQVIASDHVTTADGTGLVHMAPDFGEDDFHACKAIGIEVLLSVDDEGCFVPAVTDYAGRNVKEADPDIIRALKANGRLFARSTIKHNYPFCWRTETPLIYKAVPAWFVRVEQLRERMVEHNKEIHWVPEAVGSKRFGNWLADARDWNVSRNRFWGTPLPIWRCEDCGEARCIGSIDELSKLGGCAVTDLHPHRIDHLTMPCEACGGESRRVSHVFDCWFESGSMPYAQGHYPFEGKETFEANFPAEFIAEGLDQTRGWFYTLLVLSTALFDKPPFRNCVVNGMVLAADGSKMSKRKQNYPPADEVLDELGADALRAYLINSPIVRAEPLRFSKDGVRDVVRTVLIPLRNAWSFFVQYANIDGWHPGSGLDGVPQPAPEDRPELDRWLLSVLQSLVGEVNAQMEGYYLFRVVPPIVGFIDDLTNWYIRRSRRRFWRAATDEAGRIDKAAAYATLHEALVTFGQVMAPVLPFITEALYQNLAVGPGVAEHDSVHLCDYPEVDTARIDADLERQVAVVRQVVSLGRAVRERHRLKTRQPLRRVTIVHDDAAVRAAIDAHIDLVAEELNVKEVHARADDADLCTLEFKANFKTLGRRLGKRMKEGAALIQGLDRDAWAALQAGGPLTIADEPITTADVLVQRKAKGDVVIETDGPLTVALDTELDATLRGEGLAREVTSRVQRLRKETGLAVTDRIALTLATDDTELSAALDARRDYISGEVLATTLIIEAGAAGEHPLDVEGHVLTASLTRA